jgi:hypothetical protein
MSNNVSLYDLIGVNKDISNQDLLLLSISNKSLNKFSKIRNNLVIEALIDQKFRAIYDSVQSTGIFDRDSTDDQLSSKNSRFRYLIKKHISKIRTIIIFLSALFINLSFYNYISKFNSGITNFFYSFLFSVVIVLLYKKIGLQKNKLIENISITILIALSIIISFSIFYISIPLTLLLFFIWGYNFSNADAEKFDYKSNYNQLVQYLKQIGISVNCNNDDKFIASFSFYLWKKILKTDKIENSVFLGSSSVIIIAAILSRLSGEKVMRYPTIFTNINDNIYNLLTLDTKGIFIEKFGDEKYKDYILEVVSDISYGASEGGNFQLFINSLLKTID